MNKLSTIDDFFRKVLIIFSGSLFAQILSLITIPIITRFISPDDYGVYALFISYLSILSLAALKYENSIPLVKTKKHLILIFKVNIIILIFYSGLLFFLGLITYKILDLSIEFLFFICLGVVTHGIYMIFKMVAYRENEYKKINKSTISQSVINSILKLVLLFLGILEKGLIIATIVGQIAGISKINLLKISDLNKYPLKKYQLIYFLKKYSYFPLYSAPNKLIITISNFSPVIFIGKYYGLEYAGAYSMAIAISKTPINMIGNIVGEVFYSEMARISKDRQTVLNMSLEILKKLIYLAALPIVLILFYGEELITLLLGNNWATAGKVIEITILLSFFSLIFHPTSRVFEIYNKQKVKLILDSLRVIFTVVIFYYGYLLSYDFYHIIIIHSITMSIIYLITYSQSLVVIRRAV